MTTADKILVICREIEQMLLDKNASYGDSVSDPLRVFSKADTMEAIRVRIDDKLSRIARGTGYPGDNDVRDLVGYLVLYLVNDKPPSADQGTASKYRDRDGYIWVRVGVFYKCDTLRHMGARKYSYLNYTFGPLVEV